MGRPSTLITICEGLGTSIEDLFGKFSCFTRDTYEYSSIFRVFLLSPVEYWVVARFWALICLTNFFVST
jgi:hypothetical protein